MTDATDELFNTDSSGTQSVVFPLSRLVLDPERFTDDEKEVMADIGMGVIYTRTSDGQKLRHPPLKEERDALIQQYYRPHHKNFEKMVADCLKATGHCLIIDGHSFPSFPLPYELDQSTDRPDICIGTDDFHTPEWLMELVCGEFGNLGYSTAVNRPFAGTIVPMKFYQNNPLVTSIMIEVNRKLYMDESTGLRITGFDTVRRHILLILEKLQQSN